MNKVTAKMIDDTTMEVSFGGESRKFQAVLWINHYVARNVFSGKFRTGSKLWPISVRIELDGRVSVAQGGFSEKGGAVNLVGWWNEDSQRNTQHHGVR